MTTSDQMEPSERGIDAAIPSKPAFAPLAHPYSHNTAPGHTAPPPNAFVPATYTTPYTSYLAHHHPLPYPAATAPPFPYHPHSYSPMPPYPPQHYSSPQFGNTPHYPHGSHASASLYYAADELLRPEVEETFCNNFVCCGQYLADLHALLQHYEETHVQLEDNTTRKKRNRLEDVAAGSLLEVGGAATVTRPSTMSNADTVAPLRHPHDIHPPARHPMHHHNQLLQRNPHYSAFDNTLIRKTADSEYEYLPMTSNGMHRPMSLPPYPHSNYHQSHSTSQQPQAYGSRMQALTADKNNLQLLCSILTNSFDPTLDPPPSHPTNSNDAKSSASASPPQSIIVTAPTSASSKKHRMPATNQYVNRSIAYSSITINDRPAIIDRSSNRPYKCPIASCSKAYKNPNGLKYHAIHGHTGDEMLVERPFVCAVSGCGKKYKNPNGLKYHSLHAHNVSNHKKRGGINIVDIRQAYNNQDSDHEDSPDSDYSKSSHAEFLTDGPASEELA